MEENEKDFQNGNAPKTEKESVPQLFGRNVRKYRKERRLTQEQLSEKLGISQKHLSIIETGTQFASASLIERLCAELNVSPGDLFGGSSDEVIKEIRSARDDIMMMLMNEISHKFAMMDSDLSKIKQILSQGGKHQGMSFSENLGW